MTSPRPTDAELAILGVLWSRGPSTVRQVQDVLNEQRPTGYDRAQAAADHDGEHLVARDESDRTHVYAALDPDRNPAAAARRPARARSAGRR